MAVAIIVPAGVSGGPYQVLGRGAGGGSITTVYNHDTSGGSSDPGWNGLTIVQLIPASALGAGTGTQVRITSYFSSIGSAGIDAVYAGQKAAAGDAYDFSGTQVQMLYGGSASFGAAGAGFYTSDWVTLGEAYDNSKDYLFAFHAASGGTSVDTKMISTVSGTRVFYKSANEAGLTDKTGYTANFGGTDDAELITKIEIQ